ncbi:MAG: serine--tRNA ligase [Alphaproteobacteria bacterium]|nr:MAG: serine--tRNA ligase [Alphaproteobacteria bacterium]
MHDIGFLRSQPERFAAGLARRGLTDRATALLDIDARRRALQTDLQGLLARRNEASKEIGRLKGQGGDASALMAEVAALKERIPALEAEERSLGEELTGALEALPNIPKDEVPDGADETGNVEVRRVGTPPSFAFDPKPHDEIGPALGLMDFDAAARMSGARFVVLKGALARLERAIASFFLDVHTTEFGYTEVNPPLLVRDQAAYGVGQLPKFAEDMFRTNSEHWLITTAEVPLTNLVADQILDPASLPLRFTAWTPCFRSEAGAAGRDTRGMIRQHQFQKVELVSIVRPEDSDTEHERMTAAAEAVLTRLGLPFRTMLLCTGDMGFGSRKTYDIEVWLPGQNAYREISSCSQFGDFQARRMKARYKLEKGTAFVHTLNGSGVAVGRALVAILENYQNADGSVTIPDALMPYMGGLTRVDPVT